MVFSFVDGNNLVLKLIIWVQQIKCHLSILSLYLGGNDPTRLDVSEDKRSLSKFIIRCVILLLNHVFVSLLS